MFARLIALETKKEVLNAAGDDAFHLDYAIISGADFAKFGEKGIEEIHKLLDWAEGTQNGCILFIDEAEAFLRKRSMSDARTIRLLDTFLSRTGTSSEKIMFIFATNHPELLDDAVLSRSAEQIYFPLPGPAEREKILKLYIKKYLANDVRTIKKNGEDVEVKLAISKEITDEYLVTVATRLDNSSGREIEQMIEKIRQSAYLYPEITITKDIFERAVKETLEKKIAKMNFGLTERKHRVTQNPQTLPA
jgi:ATPase family AAA domain-containing protein 3A/B